MFLPDLQNQKKEKNPQTVDLQGFFPGAPWGIRTLDLLIRSESKAVFYGFLYPRKPL